MKLQTIIIAIFLAYVSCHEAKIGILERHDSNGNENEIISIDLKKKDGSEDIKLIAQMRIHLIEGKVHLNGNVLEHGIVNHVHMRLTIIEFENGVQKESELKPVRLRVLVVEKTGLNGSKILLIEEEFMQVEDYEVIQVDVKQIIFESMVRKPVTLISLKESTIHAQPEKDDKHVMFKDEKYHPSLPDHPLEGEDYHYHHCHHHHGHHGKHSHKNGFRKAKCWYHRLSWKSKFALFATGFLLLITLVLFCSICAKRRKQRRNRFEVTAPIDDSVAVDMDEEKKEKADEKLDFHFEFDNAVVVDDKKNLIE